MKNYLYKIELFSGFFESYFFSQINANNEKEAIIQLVSIFRNQDENNTNDFINEKLGHNWTVEQFWEDMDTRFSYEDETVGNTLLWVKEIKFDLETI